MSDETTPQDSAAMSPASAGSVGQPVAWGLLDEGEVHAAYVFKDEAAHTLNRTGDTDSVIVPLYRQPQSAITDAEREAVEAAIDRFRDWVNGTDDEEREVALRGLLERLK